MKELSDEQFDAGLKRKMEHLSLDPGKDLWTAIERELDARKKDGIGKVVLFRWIGVAAAVCLLAAAGVWMYQRAPLRENSLLAAGRSPIDTVSEESGSKVIILNRSRRRPAAAEETPVPERRPVPGEIPVREREPEGEGVPAESPAKKADPPVESPAGSPVKDFTVPGKGRSAERPSSERRMAAAGGEDLPGTVSLGAGNISGGTEVFPAGSGKAPTGSGNVRSGAGDVRLGSGNGPENSLTRVENPFDGPGNSPDGPEIFSGGPEMASAPSGSGEREKPSSAGLAESALDREAATSSADISPGETTDPKRSLLPPEVRQVDNVGEALNLIAATIDKSEDKFLQLTRDERSARWKGIRLDLGLVTISYNKPDSRKMRNNE